MTDPTRRNERAPEVNPEKSGIRTGNPQLGPQSDDGKPPREDSPDEADRQGDRPKK